MSEGTCVVAIVAIVGLVLGVRALRGDSRDVRVKGAGLELSVTGTTPAPQGLATPLPTAPRQGQQRQRKKEQGKRR
jgi:hypothetical protein